MEHIIFVNHAQVAVIVVDSPTTVAATAYSEGIPTVAWEGTSVTEAERWAKDVIGYPSET